MNEVSEKHSTTGLRSKRLHVCFSDEEFSWLLSIAELEGVNVSGMLRMLVRKEYKVVKESLPQQNKSEKKTKKKLK
jgi:hypothetical protein